mmetsp:Transcript_114823/g.297578  ORF Transcript_114823/g.297578 Transcript_114823/m.297578 type:complete len:228 (+) Transcript_114823:622-1305(+)
MADAEVECSPSARMTRCKAARPWLTARPTPTVKPPTLAQAAPSVALVLDRCVITGARSELARSAKWILAMAARLPQAPSSVPLLLPRPTAPAAAARSGNCSRRVKMVWLLEGSEQSNVEPAARLRAPNPSNRMTSAAEPQGTSDRPGTQIPSCGWSTTRMLAALLPLKRSRTCSLRISEYDAHTRGNSALPLVPFVVGGTSVQAPEEKRDSATRGMRPGSSLVPIMV